MLSSLIELLTDWIKLQFEGTQNLRNVVAKFPFLFPLDFTSLAMQWKSFQAKAKTELTKLKVYLGVPFQIILENLKRGRILKRVGPLCVSTNLKWFFFHKIKSLI